MKRLLATTLILFLTTGCQMSELLRPTDELVVRSGTSFGMCTGYCVTELHIDATEARFTRSAWRASRPPQTAVIAITQEQWGQILSSIDLNAFASLQDVYGCPDCADGGAEWVELETPGFKKRVTFEYGTNPPTLGMLLQQIRPLRQQFRQDQ